MICQPPALMDFRNTFNISDTATLPDFRSDRAGGGSLKVATNRAQCATPGSNTGRQGVWSTYVPTADYNGGRLLTDNWALEDQLIAPVGSAATDNGSAMGAAMLDAGPASGMVLVYAIYSLATSGTAAAIVTYANSTIASPGAGTSQTNQTNRATTATGVATTDLMRFERRMITATRSIFTLYKNGSSYLTWDDTTGVVPAGDRTKRRWFIQAESNFPLFQQAFYSPAHDSIRVYDLKS